MLPPTPTPLFALALSALIGACIGSFLNVCIHRWPVGQSIVTPRSHCPECGRTLSISENIPIVSWLVLRGKCRGCGTAISIQYPLIELLVAAIWLFAAWQCGVTFLALRLAVFATMMLGIAVTDARYYIIPDGFTVFGLGWVMGTAVLAVFLDPPVWAVPQWPDFATPYHAVIGACAGAGVVALAGWLGELAFRREAMGFGDVTMMAVVGAAVGPNRALLTVFLAAMLGVVIFLAIVYPIVYWRAARANETAELPLVPFGVFLAPAAVISLCFGTTLIDWYSTHVLAGL